MHRALLIVAGLTVGACNGEGTTTKTGSASETGESSSGATTEAETDATTGTTGGTTTEATTTVTTTTEATTTTVTTTITTESSTGEAEGYCHGFWVTAPEKFLEMKVVGGEPLVDGATWPLECGAQGSWMFGLYPSFGGWDPGEDSVAFTITVDVEGFNDNPQGHFFSGEVYYYIGCEDIVGGVLGVAPVFPPDTLADLAALDGKPAKVTVSIPADGESLSLTADVTLQAPPELVMMGCMFG